MRTSSAASASASRRRALRSLYIIVEYGVSIAAVAKNVIESVKYRVETMVGIKVDKVNVTVEGIRVN